MLEGNDADPCKRTETEIQQRQTPQLNDLGMVFSVHGTTEG